jgi:hypothetical protein
MPRCKALVRGGSRQCRRQALNGTGFCSIHGGPLIGRRAGSTRPGIQRALHGRAPRAPSGITGASNPISQPYVAEPSEVPWQGREINVRGIGTMYWNTLVRTRADAVKAIGGVGYIEATSKTAAARTAGYRLLPSAVFWSGAVRQYQFAVSAIGDLRSGEYPGTDEPIFLD